MNIPLAPDTIPFKVIASIGQLQFDLTSWDKNPRIGDVLAKTVLSGGKRLRPLMTFLMGDMFEIPHDVIAPYGRAVELVHASTLAHDDVIDNADSRRGKPSINIVSSNKHAVLAGDYLLAYVLGDMATRGRNNVVCELAAVIGDLAEGEWLQMENMSKPDLTRADIENVALKKTGSVLRWCSVIPPLLSDAEPDLVKVAKTFGESIGIAFQLTDDILDFQRRDGAQNADWKNGVINAVIFELLCRKANTATVDMRTCELTAPEPEVLDEAIATVRARAMEHLQTARDSLTIIEAKVPFKEAETRRIAFHALNSLMDYLAYRTK